MVEIIMVLANSQLNLNPNDRKDCMTDMRCSDMNTIQTIWAAALKLCSFMWNRLSQQVSPDSCLGSCQHHITMMKK